MISTDPTLIDLQTLNEAFASDQMPWARSLSDEELAVMLSRSICFGLYSATAETADQHQSASHSSTAASAESPQPAMIGLARLVTDCTTMAYLTDVYVAPDWQGRGLGSWLLECVKEWWDTVDSGRRLVLIAKEGPKEQYYAKVLESGRLDDEGHGYRIVSAKGKGALV